MSIPDVSNPNPDATDARPTSPKPRRDARFYTTIAVVVGLLAAIPFAVHWIVARLEHSITEDAFVESYLVNIAPMVPGHVVEVLVQESDRFEAGQLLARIDPLPFQRQVELDQAKLSVAQAQLAQEETVLQRLIEEAPRRIAIAQKELAVAEDDHAKAERTLEQTTLDVSKAIGAAESAVNAARAAFVLADDDFKRYTKLYEEKSVPQRRLEEATKVHKTANANVEIAQAKLAQAEASRKQIDIAEQNRSSTTHSIEKAQEAVKLAQLIHLQIEEARRAVEVKKQQIEETRRTLALAETNLNYTRIVAPFPGVVAKQYRYLGDYASVGAPIFSVFDTELLYVTANMEETKLEGVAEGNAATLHIDAFSKPFAGRVLWIGKATGANFSLVPRDVSSGEFTKVVQRVPIRILIDKDERWPLLKPGLSTTVWIAHGPGDPQWAAQAQRQELRLQQGVEGKGASR